MCEREDWEWPADSPPVLLANGDRLAFASELKSLLALPDFPPQVDPSRTATYRLPGWNRERYEDWLEPFRDLVRRGLKTPRTVTTDGEMGLIQAVVELEGRRDVTFPHLDRLRTLRARAVWLYRRLVQGHLFARKVQLEEKLKSVISPEAYEVYLEAAGL